MKKKEEKKIVPKYSFGEYADFELNPAEPYKKKIAKTMEITETFTMFEVLKYMANMDKAIADKESELEGLKIMKKAYEEEVKLIQDSLKLDELQKEWEKKNAEVKTGEEIFEEVINEDEEENN